VRAFGRAIHARFLQIDIGSEVLRLLAPARLSVAVIRACRAAGIVGGEAVRTRKEQTAEQAGINQLLLDSAPPWDSAHAGPQNITGFVHNHSLSLPPALLNRQEYLGSSDE